MPRSGSKKNKAAIKPQVKAIAAAKKAPQPSSPEASRAGSRPASSTSGYVLGDRVSHPKFGNGVVKAIEADKLTIQFGRKVVKQIVDYYVKHR
jgi:hypothetical protein